MPLPTREPIPDTVRVARWRTAMLSSLGDDTKEMLRRLHGPHDVARLVVLRALKSLLVSEIHLQACNLYWNDLSAEVRAKRESK